MKTICINCKATWDAGNKLLDKCPFCGALLAEEKIEKIDDFSGAIKVLIHDFGLDIFRNPDRFISLLRDYAPSNNKEIRLMSFALKAGVSKIILEADVYDVNQQEISFNKMHRLFCDELMWNDEFSVSFCSRLADALEWKYKRTRSVTDVSAAKCSVNNNNILSDCARAQYTELAQVLNSVYRKAVQQSALPNSTQIQSQYTVSANSIAIAYDEDDFIIENGCLKKYTGFDEDVFIPNCVNKIGDEAFLNCNKIISVTIPQGIRRIGSKAFAGCKNLESVVIPNSVIEIGDEAFSKCEKLATVTIPNSVSKIGDSIFEGCHSLTSVKIQYGLSKIGENMFGHCWKLTSITIPESVTTIGKKAFWGCSKLKTVIIPRNVSTIGILAFAGCREMQSITMPSSISYIGGLAFSGCSKLQSICIPKRITAINFGTFKECRSLISVFIPSNIAVIGDEAFRGCSTLSSVTIPDGLKSIKYAVFKECPNLSSVTIPKSVTDMGAACFEDSSKLTIIAPKGSYADNYASIHLKSCHRIYR